MGTDEQAGKGVNQGMGPRSDQGVGERSGHGGSERLVCSDAVVQLAHALLDELGARAVRGNAAEAVLPKGRADVVDAPSAVPASSGIAQVSIRGSSSTIKRFRMIAASRGVSHMALFEQMVRDLPERL